MNWSGSRLSFVRSGVKRQATNRKLLAAAESLERRVLLSAVPLKIVPQSERPFTTFVIDQSSSTISPPFTPSEIQTAYDLNNINFNGVAGTGAGQTIAIIDAFSDPDLASDANEFSSDYGLPQFTVAGDGGPTLTIENEYGSTSNLPAASTPGVWDAEESLDVEWAHVVAPEANILVVEGNAYTENDFTQFIANEMVAINTAKATPGVSVISMSWDVPLGSAYTATDPIFVSPSAQQGITFFAASGDSGSPEGYPADSPNVVGVGGTSLTINGDGTDGGETGWSGSGGGISPYESQPVWQGAAAKKFSATQRTTPDVAWLADPNTGVEVLDTYYNPSPFNVGGTSLASPMWAALTSIADQGRVLNGLPTLDGASQTLPMLYTLPASDFNDITSGNNGFAAGPGYDLVTGLGSPNVPSIVSDMSTAKFEYVDSSAPGVVQDGTSWASAYTSLQSVLSTPSAGREYVLVGQGTYLPGSTSAATFQLQDNQTLIGGFAGYGTDNPDASASAFPTILSGNLGNGSSSQSVVTGSGTNSTAVLLGFNISGGEGGADGGGFYDSAGNPTLLDCQFANDSANDGGAIYMVNSAPTITACTFSDDSAMNGGAIYFDAGSTPTVTDCTFMTDSATESGGGVQIAGGATPDVINSFFYGNSAGTEGGGIAVISSAGLIFGDVFVGDSAPDGAAIGNLSGSSTITNCTFNANSAASDGGAVYDSNSSSPAITNCIFWMDSASAGSEIFNADSGSEPVVTYCDVDGGYIGTAILNVDPLFTRNADPATGDYGDLTLQEFSPCINAGNNSAVPSGITTDAAGNARIIGGIVDLGAYEATAVAIYVDSIAPGPAHNGGSWMTAFTSLQAALSVATSGFTILVGQGTYTPGSGRAATFQLIDGVSIFGGYAGYGTPNPNARNIEAYPTILSGGNVDYHVVTGSGTDSTAVLDGVTITGGKANGNGGGGGLFGIGGDGDGGGLYNVDGSPTVSNCTISGDSASGNGGGVYNGGYYYGSSPTLINCNISGDSAGYYGGGMYTGGLYSGGPTLVNCKLQNDTAYYGGAIDSGGLLSSTYTTLTNCTIEGDSANHGSAIYNEYTFSGYAPITLTNCIVWNNGSGTGIKGNVYAYYSDVQGGISGDGNIEVNPQFVSSSDLQLQPDSACINAGENSALTAGDDTDLAGNPRVVDGTVDMGAYEAQTVDVAWTGGGDGSTWNDSANWSDNYVPTQHDIVTVPAGVASLQIGTGDFSVKSLSSGSSVHINGGSLSLLQSSTINGLLTIQGGGSLNLTNATLMIDYGSNADPSSTLVPYLTTGYAGGAWNGAGIVSSSVASQNASQSKLIYSVGYADGADGIVSGLSSGQFEIMPTLAGDAKLQGNVVFGDFQLLSQYFGNAGGWDEGNFNYGSAINFGDFQLLSQNFGELSGLNAAAGSSGTIVSTIASARRTTVPAVESQANQDIAPSAIDAAGSILDGTFATDVFGRRIVPDDLALA